ncbi:MAG: sigma-54-dependent Fis family transcriptional regulator [Alphaproteobacteria bacterium]|nr:MAG: sigma-54-dependent Fis family transcriptional regulator [Alphaproteobacteria bacterium]
MSTRARGAARSDGAPEVRSVLVVDDDRAVRRALAQSFELAGLHAIAAGSTTEAKDHLHADFPGVVLADIRMPGKDGFALLEHARRLDRELPVILLTGEGDVPTAVRGMSAGAFDFLEKPCPRERLLEVVGRALTHRRRVLADRALRRRVETGDAAARLIVGNSAPMQALRERVRAVARSGAEVLIEGEPGTGTVRVAEAIHLLRGGAGPFHRLAGPALDAGALAAALEAARGGSLVIEDLARVPLAEQPAAAARLEQAEGLSLMATISEPPEAALARGAVLPELLYRFDLARLRVPPLRERREDIPALFLHFVRRAAEEAGVAAPEVPPDLLDALVSRDWPGNTRALQNAAMRFVLGLETPDGGGGGLAERMRRVERAFLIDALRRTRGNAAEAARFLELPHRTFYDKLARHGLRPEDYRD